MQRDFQYCVIDEVDSILIDEARTPLIISGQVERPQEKYQKAADVANALVRAAELGKDGIDPDGDYEVDEKQRSCTLTDEGFAKAEQILGVVDLFNPQDPGPTTSPTSKAKELFVKDVNYIVRDGEAVIVDEFTDGDARPPLEMAKIRRSRPRVLRSSLKPRLSLRSLTRTSSFISPGWHDRYAKTEEVEFGVTKLETTIVPPTGCAPARTGLIRFTKPRPSGEP